MRRKYAMAGGALVLILVIIVIVVLGFRNSGNMGQKPDRELTNEQISSQGGKDETEIIEDASLPEESNTNRTETDKTNTDKTDADKTESDKQENKGDSTWIENPGSETPKEPDASIPEEPDTSTPVELPFVPAGG